jgi:hypothetical protein
MWALMNAVINFEAVHKTKECVAHSQLLASDYYVRLLNNTAVRLPTEGTGVVYSTTAIRHQYWV